MTRRKRQEESVIKDAIRDYLRYRGWFAFYVWQGLYSHEGISDVIAVRKGISYYIEVKRPGKEQTDAQRDFQKDVEEHGAEYTVLHSLEEVIAWEQMHND